MPLVIHKGKPPVFPFGWGLLLVAGSREKLVVGGADCKNSHGIVRKVEISWDWRSRNEASWEPELDLETLCSFVIWVHKCQSVCTFLSSQILAYSFPLLKIFLLIFLLIPISVWLLLSLVVISVALIPFLSILPQL